MHKVVTAWVTNMGLTSIAKALSFKCGAKLLRLKKYFLISYLNLLCDRGVERIGELQDTTIIVRKESGLQKIR